MSTIKQWFVSNILRDWPRKKLRRCLDELASQGQLSGLFTGLRFTGQSICSEYYPKVIGSYEKELIPAFEKLLRHRFERIVNVGAAEGWYATGLAKRTGNEVLAFEASGTGLLEEMARLNGVADKIKALGKCELKDLNDALAGAGNALIVMDVEGAEHELLDPMACPALKLSSLVVELHECFVPGITETVRERFAPTHSISWFQQAPREPDDFPLEKLPWLPFNPREYLREYLDERRPEGNSWVVLIPKDTEIEAHPQGSQNAGGMP